MHLPQQDTTQYTKKKTQIFRAESEPATPGCGQLNQTAHASKSAATEIGF